MSSPYSVYSYPLVVLRIGKISAADIIARMISFEFNDAHEEHRGNKKAKKVPMVVFHIADPDGDFVNDPRMESDTVWELRWGYPLEMSNTWRMRVKFFEPEYPETGQVTLKVTLMGSEKELQRVRSSFNWGNIPASAIAQLVAARYGMATRIEPSLDVPLEPYVQSQDESDFDFLQHLAERIDFEFFVETVAGLDTLFFRSRDTAFTESPRLSFTYYGDVAPTLMKSFRPIIRVKGAKVKSVGADHKTGRATAVRATTQTVGGTNLGGMPVAKDPIDPTAMPIAGSANTGRVSVSALTGQAAKRVIDLETGLTVAVLDGASAVARTAETSPQIVQQIAKAARRSILDRAVEAEGTFIGSPLIRTKAVYQVRGVDRRLAGNWYCVESTHKIDGSGYTTTAKFKRGAYRQRGGNMAQPNLSSENNRGPLPIPSAPRTLKYSVETGLQVDVPPLNPLAVSNRQ